MDIVSPFVAAFAWLRRTRCKFLLVMTLLCLVLRENYPFSHFPMYASFSKKSYYLYLADAKGDEIPTRPFAISNSSLRKIYDSDYRIARKRFADSGSERVHLSENAAGQALLQYLEALPGASAQVKKRLAHAQVRRVDVYQEGSQLLFQTRIVATQP
jgi:hypothetical protein